MTNLKLKNNVGERKPTSSIPFSLGRMGWIFIAILRFLSVALTHGHIFQDKCTRNFDEGGGGRVGAGVISGPHSGWPRPL
jgi:hypothetical protein